MGPRPKGGPGPKVGPRVAGCGAGADNKNSNKKNNSASRFSPAQTHSEKIVRSDTLTLTITTTSSTKIVGFLFCMKYHMSTVALRQH